MLTMAIGWADPDAPGLWARLCESAALPLGPGVDTRLEPDRPWLADRIEPALLTLADREGAAVAHWSADLAAPLAGAGR